MDTETVTVSGNGTYTTPTGFTLPTTGTVTGTYQWDASYSGDANNNAASDNGAVNEQVTVSPASPTLTTTPSPATVTLGTTAPSRLTDTATLWQAAITRPARSPSRCSQRAAPPVDTETVTVSGNGTYTTPTGFTLPTTGTVTGTYQWDASLQRRRQQQRRQRQRRRRRAGDGQPGQPDARDHRQPDRDGHAGHDVADADRLGRCWRAATTRPAASLFTLTSRAAPRCTRRRDAVSGNGTYTTPSGFTLPTTGTVTGTYQWAATYSGDANNNAANDQGGAAEQVTVSPASPTLTTTPNPTTVTLGATAPPILTDTADLAGGYFPTGDITFTLFQGSTLVHTETVAVSGNGTYTTPTGFTLPTTGTVAGTYQWVAVYSGDGNNGEASDSDPAAEQVTVNPASPTLVTTASPTTVTLPAPVPTS